MLFLFPLLFMIRFSCPRCRDGTKCLERMALDEEGSGTDNKDGNYRFRAPFLTPPPLAAEGDRHDFLTGDKKVPGTFNIAKGS